MAGQQLVFRHFAGKLKSSVDILSKNCVHVHICMCIYIYKSMYLYMYISAYKIVFIAFSVREPSLPPCYALAAVSMEFSCSLHDLETAA